jgi:hypothetical protein
MWKETHLRPLIKNFYINISLTPSANLIIVKSTDRQTSITAACELSTTWQAFRIFFYDLFSNGSITNPIFLGNKQKIAG